MWSDLNVLRCIHSKKQVSQMDRFSNRILQTTGAEVMIARPVTARNRLSSRAAQTARDPPHANCVTHGKLRAAWRECVM
jgi:hypothetical protein